MSAPQEFELMNSTKRRSVVSEYRRQSAIFEADIAMPAESMPGNPCRGSSKSQKFQRGNQVDDADIGIGIAVTTNGDEETVQHAVQNVPFVTRHKPWIVAHWTMFLFSIFWLVMTGWYIAAMVLHNKDKNWVIPTVLYIFLTIRMITFWIDTTPATELLSKTSMKLAYKPAHKIPRRIRLPLSAFGTVCVFILGAFITPETADNTRANRAVSLAGLLVLIGAFYATSRDRKHICWKTVIVGMLAQYLIALFVLRTKVGYDIFNFIAFLAKSLLGFAALGTVFLAGQEAYDLHTFILNVIPPIIFFIAIVQLLYYWGWLQWVIKKFAVIFYYTMGVSGAEAVVAAASPFVGQGESAMLIKPFIPFLTSAELHQVMASGFATIAGSVLAAYIGMGLNPVALISSCVMSIPASLAISKLRYPETEMSFTADNVIIPDVDPNDVPTNSLHAFSTGSAIAIKIAGIIISALLCIIALLGLANGLLHWWGSYLSIKDLSIQLIMSYLLYPVAALLGVARKDILKVAKLIGTKVVANEFVAFMALTADETLSPRSRLITTYALCGFGNIASVGIQVGILSQLAPLSSRSIARVATSALITGVFATLTSASIAGMLITDSTAYTKVN